MSTSRLSKFIALCFTISTATNLAAQDCDGNGIQDSQEIAANSYMDSNKNGVLDSCEGLSVDLDKLSLSNGGQQRLHIDLGPNAAYQVYRFLGSLDGDGPGMVVGSVYLPLTWDGPKGYMNHTINKPSGGFLTNGIGYLDQQGRANAWFTLPAGMDPSLAGVNLHHAYMILYWNGAFPLWSSNSVRVELIP